MVTRILFLFLLLPSLLLSEEFTASVSRNQIAPGESFTLSLTLQGASAQGTPFVDKLKQSFIINSQQQSSNTSIVNGRMSSSLTWRYTLIPQKEGEIIIPSISINTTKGPLSSQPIAIKVAKGTAGGDSSDTSNITLTSDVSNARPYKNEPVIYTVRLVSKRDLANIKAEKLNVENAIVESNGEPKVEKKFIDGINVAIIEFSYLITPLKAGSLKIPPLVIQGALPTKRKSRMGFFFDDDFDAFSMMQFNPFALTTEEALLDVQPAVPGMTPWLPARSLTIEETTNIPEFLEAGAPLTRSFKIRAEGVKSSQLPSLSDLQISDSQFKIYADKPEVGDEVQDGKITSYRKEQYTLIPQQAGALTLPAITLGWWDTAKKEAAFAKIPSKTVQVLPSPDNVKSHVSSQPHDDSIASVDQQALQPHRDPVLYGLLAGLAVLLIAAVVWGIALQKKIGRLTDKPVKQKTANTVEKRPASNVKAQRMHSVKNKNEQLPDLNPT